MDRDGQVDFTIRAADPQEGARLREIAIGAKSYWGYDLERVVQWADMGDYSPRGLRAKDVYVAEIDGDRLIGWASLIPRGDVCWLDDLWVDPDWIGRRVGTGLFRYVVAQSRHRRASRIEWEAEPHALGFYKKMGGRYLRDGEPSIWGRVHPVMGIDLS